MKDTPVSMINTLARVFFVSLFIVLSSNSFSQLQEGFIRGRVYDGHTLRPLFGVKVFKPGTSKIDLTLPDGSFSILLDKGFHDLIFEGTGYSVKEIDSIKLLNGGMVHLDVFLFPEGSGDSASHLKAKHSKNQDNRLNSESLVYLDRKEVNHSLNSLSRSHSSDEYMILGSLPGVIIRDERTNTYGFSLSGLSSRYSIYSINGAVQLSSTQLGKSYLAGHLPPYLVSEAGVKFNQEGGEQGEASGGVVSVRVKDMPDQPFLRIQLGTGFELNHNNEVFLGDKLTLTELAGLPGFTKKLPGQFPNTTTRDRLLDKNPQEKVDLLRSLPNNLAPQERNKVGPDENFELGWGKTFILKKKQKWGVIGYLSHSLLRNIENGSAAVLTNAVSNPYPFQSNGRVLQAFSDNRGYNTTSRLNAVISSSFLTGTNKFGILLAYNRNNLSTYIEKRGVLKPDEDSLAESAVRYMSEQKRSWQVILNGDHALGPRKGLSFKWTAAYTNYQQSNPDDRNFLLRTDPAKEGLFELAQQQTQPLPDRNNVSRSVLDANLDAIFTNSGRSWRKMVDHYFTGDASLSFPFTFLGRSSLAAGGISIRSQYRVLYSDQLLYKGTGYVEPDSILAPQRYYPGGLDAEEYYTKIIRGTGSFNLNDVNGDNLGNYTGSSNIGAAYISHAFQLARRLGLSWGLRVESGSQLVSLFEYNYFEGFRKADKIALDENTRVTEFDVLPSASLRFRIAPGMSFYANYFRSLNRPVIQELSSYRYYDPEMSTIYTGNGLLSNTTLDNFRGSFILAGQGGSMLTLSGHFRKIYQPVENVLTRFAASQAILLSTPHNMPEASVYGVQVLLETDLSVNPDSWLSRIRLAGGADWNHAIVDKGPIKSSSTPFVEEHKLSGSPEWSANASLTTDFSGIPNLTIGMRYNSDYLVSVGSGKWVQLPDNKRITAIPSIWMKGRTQLDVQLSQSVFRSQGKLIVGITNLVGDKYLFYQDTNGNNRFDGQLQVFTSGNQRGLFKSGTDNVVRSLEGQRTIYFRLSIQIK